MQTRCALHVVPYYGGQALTDHAQSATITVAPELDVRAIGRTVEYAITSLRRVGTDVREAGYAFHLTFK